MAIESTNYNLVRSGVELLFAIDIIYIKSKFKLWLYISNQRPI